jgi:hypothetical protein
MEAQRLKMEPWRVCMPGVADFHHFDEEQDPDPDPYPHGSEIRIRIRITVKRRIRISICICIVSLANPPEGKYFVFFLSKP